MSYASRRTWPKNYRSVRAGVHILAWTLYFMLMLFPPFLNTTIQGKLYYGAHFAILVAATYTNIGVLIPKFFNKERYRHYLYSVLLIWVMGLAAVAFSGLILQYPLATGAKFLKYTMGAMIGFSMEFFLLAMYKAAKEWYQKSKRSKELEYEKMQAELNLLRSQLDAHFIFNTLNNLYLLVLNKSDKAPDAILMLSDLLSYSIYERHNKQVPLSKELGFIENYISLQKLRLDDKQHVYFNASYSKDVLIEPLILFNFIENTFKHAYGMVQANGNAYHVYIQVSASEDRLLLKTINGKSPRVAGRTDKAHKGVGMNNAVKRLNLAYSERYELDINETEQEYWLTLKISGL